MDPSLAEKYEELRNILKDIGKAAIAFSGGVDSTLLLKVARGVLGRDDVLAVYGDSVLQKIETGRLVRFLADEIGVRLLVNDYAPLSRPEVTANSEERCYHCKKAIYSGFLKIIPPDHALLDASQLDDLAQVRPGMKAIKELGVGNPLVEASFRKKDVRRLAKHLQLPNWLSPSESCLATRIKTGKPITEAELEDIARGEEFLGGLGFNGCRVRYDNRMVFISLVDEDYGRIRDSVLREKIEKFFLSLDYQQVFLTLLGRPDIEV